MLRPRTNHHHAHHRYTPLNVLLALLASMTLTSCLGRADSTSGSGVVITMATSPAKGATPPTHIEVTLKDDAGQPLDGATVTIRGDMTMAGMAPIVTTATAAGHGRYVAGPLTFSMGGDWVISVSGKLADGRPLAKQFPPLHVSSP